jgi:REP element-mobilizing transposase RayT
MARFARVIALGVPHHITQRGNARRFILDSDADRRVYLDLLRQSAERSEIELIGYCLMSNHVHLIAIPNKANVLGLALKDAHGRYASYWNAMRCSSGHVWQGRYYSCPLDESHLWEALRYTELNPVRASMVAKAEGWAGPVRLLIAAQRWQSHGSGWSCGGSAGLLQAGASTWRLANPRPRWLRFVTTRTRAGRSGRRSSCAQWKGRQSGALLCKSVDPSERRSRERVRERFRLGLS